MSIIISWVGTIYGGVCEEQNTLPFLQLLKVTFGRILLHDRFGSTNFLDLSIVGNNGRMLHWKFENWKGSWIQDIRGRAGQPAFLPRITVRLQQTALTHRRCNCLLAGMH